MASNLLGKLDGGKNLIQDKLRSIERSLNVSGIAEQVANVSEQVLASKTFNFKPLNEVAGGLKSLAGGVQDVVSQLPESIPDQVTNLLSVAQLDKSAHKDLVKAVGGAAGDIASITGNSKLSADGVLDVVILAPFPEAIAAAMGTVTTASKSEIKALVGENIDVNTFQDDILDDVLGDVFKDKKSILNNTLNAVGDVFKGTNKVLKEVNKGFGSLIQDIIEDVAAPASSAIASVTKIGDVQKYVPADQLKTIIELKTAGDINSAVKIMKKYSDKTDAELRTVVKSIDNRASTQIKPPTVQIDIPTKRTDNFKKLWREATTDINSSIFDYILNDGEIETEVANMEREVTEVVLMAMGETNGQPTTVEEWHQVYVNNKGLGYNPHLYISMHGVVARGRPLEVDGLGASAHNKRSIIIHVEAIKGPFNSFIDIALKRVLKEIYNARPGIQVFGQNQINPKETAPYFDVDVYIQRTFGKTNVPDYDPSKSPPLTRQQLANYRG